MKNEIEPMKVGATVAIAVLREAWLGALNGYPKGKAFATTRERKAHKAVLEVRDECFVGMSDEQALAVAKGEATLRGWSHLGFTFHAAPDDVVGEYIPERDDAGAPGWVQPEWSLDGTGWWHCKIGEHEVGAWSREQWHTYRRMQRGTSVYKTIVENMIASGVESVEVEPPLDVLRQLHGEPQLMKTWYKDADKVAAEQLANTIARDPSTVGGSTVTVVDKASGDVLATAIAPKEETRDAVMSVMESAMGPLDKKLEEIAAHTAQKHDEVHEQVEQLYDRMALDTSNDLDKLFDDGGES